MRIISLLPSATEIICGLGFRDRLVGVTHECDYPPDVADLPKVTKSFIPPDATSGEIDELVRARLKSERALYSLDLPVFESLQPDLIVTQALCDVCAVAASEVQAAAGTLPTHPQVINLEPTCLHEVLQSIRQVGIAADCVTIAEAYIARLQRRIDTVAQRSQSITHRPRVMLLEWIDPPFCAGHWNPELVALAGGREVIGVAGERSAAISWEEIIAADPEVMVIACCGFDVQRTMQDMPILQARPHWNSLACVKAKRVHVVCGSSYFNRPGPRLVDSLEILAAALHPQIHSPPATRATAVCAALSLPRNLT